MIKFAPSSTAREMTLAVARKVVTIPVRGWLASPVLNVSTVSGSGWTAAASKIVSIACWMVVLIVVMSYASGDLERESSRDIRNPRPKGELRWRPGSGKELVLQTLGLSI